MLGLEKSSNLLGANKVSNTTKAVLENLPHNRDIFLK